MLREIENIPKRERFIKGHKQGFNNSKFIDIVDEEIDISLSRGKAYNSHGRGKHRSLVKGAYALSTYRKGGWRY